MRIARSALILAVLVAGCAAKPAAVNLETNTWLEKQGEKLMFPVPDDWEVVAQTKTGNLAEVKMVPRGQTESNWTELIAGQFHSDVKEQGTPEQFYERMAAKWRGGCRNARTEFLGSADSNGYPSASWWMTCPSNASSGRPEASYVLAVAARETFVVVQKTWRSIPPQPLVDKWKEDLFSAVIICDTQDEQLHPCPVMGRSEPSGG